MPSQKHVGMLKPYVADGHDNAQEGYRERVEAPPLGTQRTRDEYAGYKADRVARYSKASNPDPGSRSVIQRRDELLVIRHEANAFSDAS